MSAPELLEKLRLTFDPQMPALPDTEDMDPAVSDDSWNELFNVELSTVYAPKFGRTQASEPEVVLFKVFKVNTWNKNSPHTLELHRVTGNLVVRDGHDAEGGKAKAALDNDQLQGVLRGDKKGTCAADEATATLVYKSSDAEQPDEIVHKTYLFDTVSEREVFLRLWFHVLEHRQNAAFQASSQAHARALTASNNHTSRGASNSFTALAAKSTTLRRLRAGTNPTAFNQQSTSLDRTSSAPAKISQQYPSSSDTTSAGKTSFKRLSVSGSSFGASKISSMPAPLPPGSASSVASASSLFSPVGELQAPTMAPPPPPTASSVRQVSAIAFVAQNPASDDFGDEDEFDDGDVSEDEMDGVVPPPLDDLHALISEVQTLPVDEFRARFGSVDRGQRKSMDQGVNLSVPQVDDENDDVVESDDDNEDRPPPPSEEPPTAPLGKNRLAALAASLPTEQELPPLPAGPRPNAQPPQSSSPSLAPSVAAAAAMSAAKRRTASNNELPPLPAEPPPPAETVQASGAGSNQKMSSFQSAIAAFSRKTELTQPKRPMLNIKTSSHAQNEPSSPPPLPAEPAPMSASTGSNSASSFHAAIANFGGGSGSASSSRRGSSTGVSDPADMVAIAEAKRREAAELKRRTEEQKQKLEELARKRAALREAEQEAERQRVAAAKAAEDARVREAELQRQQLEVELMEVEKRRQAKLAEEQATIKALTERRKRDEEARRKAHLEATRAAIAEAAEYRRRTEAEAKEAATHEEAELAAREAKAKQEQERERAEKEKAARPASQKPQPPPPPPRKPAAPLADILAARNRASTAPPAAARPAGSVPPPPPPGRVVPPPPPPARTIPPPPPPRVAGAAPGKVNAPTPPPPPAVKAPSLPPALKPGASSSSASGAARPPPPSGNVLAQILAARNAKLAASGTASARPDNSAAALAAVGGISGLLANLKSQMAIAVKVVESAKPVAWTPQPPNTSDVSLSPELIDIAGDMAQALHKLWRENKSKEGYGFVPGDDDEDVGAPMSLRRDMTMMMGMMAMGMRRRDDDDDDDEKERKDDGDTALRALPSMMAEQLLKCLALLGARFIPATSRLSDKYSAVLPDKRDSLFRQVAASAHDVICDFVFRQSPSSKSQIHPSLLQPFDQLTSAQQARLSTDVSVLFEVACKHLLVLRECAADASEIDVNDDQSSADE